MPIKKSINVVGPLNSNYYDTIHTIQGIFFISHNDCIFSPSSAAQNHNNLGLVPLSAIVGDFCSSLTYDYVACLLIDYPSSYMLK